MDNKEWVKVIDELEEGMALLDIDDREAYSHQSFIVIPLKYWEAFKSKMEGK